MKNLNLTTLETKIITSLLSRMNAYDLGYSDVDATDIANDISVHIDSVKGSLGSLVKKGIVFCSDLKDVGSIIYLQDEFYYLHPEYTK
jgi:DNA-binding MarR family transcriptional regulator